MGKIVLNEDKCLGCGACCSIAQNNFEFNDEGKASLINDTITNEAIEASEMCPTRAISIEETCNCCHCNCEDSDCNCDDKCECSDECNCGCKK